MSKNLENAGTQHHVAEVVHHGEQLTIPEQMTIDGAIRLLLERKEYMEQKVNIQRSFNRFPWDGAYAVHQVLRERYGWAQMKAIQSMFGEQPPRLIEIEIDPGRFESVPWGQFSLPNIEDGRINCGFDGNNFILTATVRRKYEAYVRELFTLVDEYLKLNSIYMGKPVRLRYTEGEELPDISFVDVEDHDIDKLIYTKEVDGAIRTNLFTPISRIQDCVDNGISIKRGVLLAGPYGTGKTLAAKAAAKKARESGVTFIYIDSATDFAKATEFAKTYCDPAAVIFCEDIDRVTSGERSQEIDTILNIIDGVDSKNFNIMTVLTTNRLEKITPAMQRPGRLDAIIEVTPPDADAAIRLVRAYGGNLIPEDADLTKVGNELEGYIPAVIAEVVKRAKLSQIRLSEPGETLKHISEEAILDAIVSIRPQAERLQGLTETDAEPQMDRAFTEVVTRTVDERIAPLDSLVRQIYNSVC